MVHNKIYRNCFKKEADVSIKIFTCGDIVIKSNKDKILSDEIKKLISSADISICNFEGPIESKGKSIPKAGPHVKQLKEAISILKNVGFNVFSLANNHIYDYGDEGLGATIEELKRCIVGYVGAGLDFECAYKPKIIKIEDTKIGFLAFCEAEFGSLTEDENRGGYAWINHPSVNRIVIDTKSKVDILIMIIHAGAEDVPLPLPEWQNRYKELCDLGADVIIGHHPHVPQGWEEYKNSLIFYSLGNFYMNWGEFKQRNDFSYSVMLTFENKKVQGYKIITHKKENNKIVLINYKCSKNYLDKLNYILQNQYEYYSNQQVIYLYETRYKNYYKSYGMAISQNMSLLHKIKIITKQLFFNNYNIGNRELLLLHNIRIDTHRFATQRALSLIAEKRLDINCKEIKRLIEEYKCL